VIPEQSSNLIIPALVNNYFGRQFNSLNDLVVNPTNGDLYFTDTLYGYLQDFRPYPGLREQVYRYNFHTGALTVVADDFGHPNGVTTSPLLRRFTRMTSVPTAPSATARPSRIFPLASQMVSSARGHAILSAVANVP
jgi:hypothetical protein